MAFAFPPIPTTHPTPLPPAHPLYCAIGDIAGTGKKVAQIQAVLASYKKCVVMKHLLKYCFR